MHSSLSRDSFFRRTRLTLSTVELSGRSSPVSCLEKELAQLESELQISTISSQSALLPVLVIFEARLTELDVLELGRRLMPEYPSSMSLRYQYEDVLSKVIRLALARDGMPRSLNTSLNRSNLEAACQAWTFELTYDIIMHHIEASRVSLVEIESCDSTIAFRPSKDMEKIIEYERGLALRSTRIEDELATLRTSELKKSERIESTDWWYCYLVHLMKDQGFEGKERLESCSTLEYARLWSVMMRMSHDRVLKSYIRYRNAFAGKKLKLDDIIELLLILPKKSLIQSIAANTSLEKERIDAIIDTLTFRDPPESDEIFFRPIIQVGRMILISPHVIFNNFVFRNLRRRLAIELPTRYSLLARELGDNFRKRIEGTLRKASYEVRSTIKLKDSLGRDITDIDVLAYKSNLLLIIQLKNIAASDSGDWNEILRAYEETSEGVSQLKSSVSFVRERLMQVMKDHFGGQAAYNQIRIIPVLVTGVKIEEVFKNVDVSIVDLYEFERRVNEGSVVDLLVPEKVVPDIHIAREFSEETLQGQIGRFHVKMGIFIHPIHREQISLQRGKIFSFEERFDLKHVLDDLLV